ncbi:MAG: hypothetical protein R3E91_02795 [Chlamydiales bacterium]
MSEGLTKINLLNESIIWAQTKEETLSHEEKESIKKAYTRFEQPFVNFEDGSFSPSPYSPYRQINYQLSLPETLVLNHQNPTKKQMSLIQRMGEKFNSLIQFTKKHPWLMTGIAIAVLLFIITTYLAISAAFGHKTIYIFKASPELGIGMAFMTLYYGVYLINMCRRVIVKDNLEQQIHSIQKKIDLRGDFTTKIIENYYLNKKKIVKKFKYLNKKIENTHTASLNIRQKTRLAHEKLRQEYQKANKTLDKIKHYQKTLEDLLPDHSPNTKNSIKKVLKKLSKSLQDCPTELSFPELPEELPEIPLLTVNSETISSGDSGDFELIAEENVKKAQSIGKCFHLLLQNIKIFIKENPGSFALIIVGLAICLLAGVATSFWLHGVSSIYLFGSLTIMTIIPMFMYGLSLIYEGHNSRTINNLKRTIENVKNHDIKREGMLRKEKEKLDKIQFEAKKKFQEFRDYWQKIHQIESKIHTQALEKLNIRKISQWYKIEGLCKGILNSITPAYPEINKSIVETFLKDGHEGAVIIGNHLREQL